MRWQVEDEKGEHFRGKVETYAFAPINVCLKCFLIKKSQKIHYLYTVSAAAVNGFSRCFSEGFVKVLYSFIVILKQKNKKLR